MDFRTPSASLQRRRLGAIWRLPFLRGWNRVPPLRLAQGRRGRVTVLSRDQNQALRRQRTYHHPPKHGPHRALRSSHHRPVVDSATFAIRVVSSLLLLFLQGPRRQSYPTDHMELRQKTHDWESRTTMKTHNVHVSKATAFEFMLQILARVAADRSARSPLLSPRQFQRPRCELLSHADPPEASNRSAPPRTAFNRRLSILAGILALLILAVMPAHAHWPNTNDTKFVQFPDTSSNGMDIFLKNFPTILADDFICTNTGPISDIHLWLSSLQNFPTTGAQFELSIWSDVQADPTTGQLSHPGVRLWSETFNPGDYSIVVAYTNLNETFWDLDPVTFMGPDNTLFQYNFYPKQPYTQTGNPTNHVIYWLGVSMVGNDPFQGWKTSTNHLGPDFAVLGHYAGANVTDWRTLYDPRVPANSVGLDFSFALTTRSDNPTNPPPQECVDTNKVKYVQDPQVDGGWDVWNSAQWVAADDFICTNTGPITDIHIWGSWLNDIEDP